MKVKLFPPLSTLPSMRTSFLLYVKLWSHSRSVLRCVAILIVLLTFIADSFSLPSLLTVEAENSCQVNSQQTQTSSCCSKKKKTTSTGCGCSASRQENGTCCCAKKSAKSAPNDCKSNKRKKTSPPALYCPCGSQKRLLASSISYPRLLTDPVFFSSHVIIHRYTKLLSDRSDNPCFTPDPPPPQNVI